MSMHNKQNIAWPLVHTNFIFLSSTYKYYLNTVRSWAVSEIERVSAGNEKMRRTIFIFSFPALTRSISDTTQIVSQHTP